MLGLLSKFSKRIAFLQAVVSLMDTVGSTPEWEDAIAALKKAEADGRIQVTEWSTIGSQLGLYNYND